MITIVDEKLRREALQFSLRFTCESCAYLDTDGGKCSHAYPNEAHRGVDLTKVDEVRFCKEFELA
ncbi:MAG: hypothetical protein CSA75_05555 [Sorangium cellulosum]|nr:MAG: hypothetical protein CSA75_05555 [Sorangium cellulosum]